MKTNKKPNIGDAPSRVSLLPVDSQERTDILAGTIRLHNIFVSAMGWRACRYKNLRIASGSFFNRHNAGYWV